MIFFITQLTISFVTIYLRGVQTHNVVRGNYKGAAITSLGMSVANVSFIGLVASDPYASFIPVALGGCAGVLSAMWYKRRKE